MNKQIETDSYREQTDGFERGWGDGGLDKKAKG